MGEGGVASSNRVTQQITTRGGNLAGGGPDLERGRGITRNRPCGGDLEGSGGDSQSPLDHHHHLLRLPPWIPGGSKYRDRHPRSQAASEGCSLEGEGPPYDLP